MNVQNEKHYTYRSRASNSDELMINRRRSNGYLISLSSLPVACHSGGQVWPLCSSSPPRTPPTVGLSRPRCSRSSYWGCRPLSLSSISAGQRSHEISLDEVDVVAIISEKVSIPTYREINHLLWGVPLCMPHMGGRWPRDYLLR